MSNIWWIVTKLLHLLNYSINNRNNIYLTSVVSVSTNSYLYNWCEISVLIEQFNHSIKTMQRLDVQSVHVRHVIVINSVEFQEVLVPTRYCFWYFSCLIIISYAKGYADKQNDCWQPSHKIKNNNNFFHAGYNVKNSLEQSWTLIRSTMKLKHCYTICFQKDRLCGMNL